MKKEDASSTLQKALIPLLIEKLWPIILSVVLSVWPISGHSVQKLSQTRDTQNTRLYYY